MPDEEEGEPDWPAAFPVGLEDWVMEERTLSSRLVWLASSWERDVFAAPVVATC